MKVEVSGFVVSAIEVISTAPVRLVESLVFIMSKREIKNIEKEIKRDICLTKDAGKPCVEGRVYTSTLLSNLPGAILTAATASLLTVIRDSKTRIVADVTLINSLSSNSGLSAIVNGTDQEIDAGDIFELL